MTQPEMRAVCLAAGVLPSEMLHDPVHGLMINAAGVRKLAAARADTKGKMELLAHVRDAEGQKPRRSPTTDSPPQCAPGAAMGAAFWHRRTGVTARHTQPA